MFCEKTVMDECKQRVIFGEVIACRHPQVYGNGPANLVTVKQCTNCHHSKVPCPNPRPMPTEYQARTAVTARAQPVTLPDCVYLGDANGEIATCPSCNGGQGTRLFVFNCSAFGTHATCTKGKLVESRGCCKGCLVYSPKDETENHSICDHAT